MEDLKGSVALVTGSTRGIGKAAAIELARCGAKVAVHGMNEERGLQVVEEIGSFGGTAVFESMDLLAPEAPRLLIERVAGHWGSLDILVNNAARICNKPLEEIAHADWDALFAVNVKAPFFLTQQALPWFREAGGGSVINVSSINRLVNSPNNLVYDTMKAALNHMTRGLSLDLRAAGVRVNAIMPGGTSTPLLQKWLAMKVKTPQEAVPARVEELSQIASPEQIAPIIAFLASERSAWINGTEIPVDGGYFIG